MISLLFLIDPRKPSLIYIKKDTGGEIKLSGDIHIDIQHKIDYFKAMGYLPSFYRARSPGLVWNWPPIGWVNTYDDPINMLIFIGNASKERSQVIIREVFSEIGFFNASIWHFGFLTRYDKPVEIEMFKEFTAGRGEIHEGLQIHLRGFYGGEDKDLGQVWFFNGHAEYRTSDVIRHVTGAHIPDEVVKSSDVLDRRGVKWESFERQFDKLLKKEIRKDYILIYKGIFNYSNNGYYSGFGRSAKGDKYLYVDGQIPAILIRAL